MTLHRLMISYPSGGLNQRLGRLRGMRSLELTPSRVSMRVAPWRVGAQHGMNHPHQLARGGNAGGGPAESLGLRAVVLRQPTVGRVACVGHNRAHQGPAEPAIRRHGNSAVTHGALAGLFGPRH